MRVSLVALLSAVTAVSLAGSASASRTASVVVKHGPPALLVTHSLSTNWSGYASYGAGPFTDVQGSWTQPSADCSGTNRSTYSSFWVGLDGYNSSSVEQIGTDADCSHGTPSYYAWFEMYPNPMATIATISVSPGTTYSAEVKYNGGGSFTLTLSGGGQSFTTTQSLSNASLSSAEWIAEAPSLCAGGCHVAPLTDFGTVNFSGASANGHAIDYAGWSNDPLTMVTNGLQVKAQPSSLTGGSAFAVTWFHF